MKRELYEISPKMNRLHQKLINKPDSESGEDKRRRRATLLTSDQNFRTSPSLGERELIVLLDDE